MEQPSTPAVDIIASLASSTGLRFEDIKLLVRHLREEGYFVREVKGPRSPRATFRHCANLVAAILSNYPARRVAEAVKRLEETELNGEDYRHLVDIPENERPPWFGLSNKEYHSFIDHLEDLIRYTANNPYAVNTLDVDWWNIEVDQVSMEGNIWLSWNNSPNPMADPSSSHFQYLPSGPVYERPFSRKSSIRLSVILDLAKALSNA